MLNSLTPITASAESKAKHNVSYIELDDNLKLDHHVLQALQHGFTFACVLNEQEIAQSTFLLNIRLETDNATLVWSKPAWDITDAWSNASAPSASSVQASNASATTPSVTKDSKDAKDTRYHHHSRVKSSLMSNSLLMPYEATTSHHVTKGGASFRSRSQKFLESNFMPQFRKNHTLKVSHKVGSSRMSKSLSARRKNTTSVDPRGDSRADMLKHSLLNQRAKRLKRLNSLSDEFVGAKPSKRSLLAGPRRSLSSSSLSLDEHEGIVCDQVDSNIIYSVSSLTRRYVYREQVSVSDPNEGFIDLNSIKHIRHGCLDTQVFHQMQQQVAAKYAIANFGHSNVVSIVYGATFSENRY